MSEQTMGRGAWKLMGAKLWVLLPTKVLQWLEGSKEKHSKHPLLYIMTGLIVSLAIASMWNFVTRASTHHAGVSAYLGGIALAGLVPVTVFFAVYANITPNQRKGVWVIAGLFVFLSASIQFPVYAGVRLTLNYLFSSSFDLEAFAFGAGNPIAECLLAVMEAMYLNSLAKVEAGQLAEVEAQQIADERTAKQAEMDRKTQIRRDLDEQAERLRKQQEFEAKQLQDQREFELKLKLQEAEAMAKIEMERLKVEAKLVAKPATQSAINQKVKPAIQSTGYDDQLAMLAIYQSEPSLSDEKMAARIGKSKKTVQDLLADLVAKDVAHVEKSGRGKSVAVNGKLSAFQAGEI